MQVDQGGSSRVKAGDDLDLTEGGGGGMLSPKLDDKMCGEWQVAVAYTESCV